MSNKRCNYSPKDMHRDRMKKLPSLIEKAKLDLSLAILSVNLKKQDIDKLTNERENLDDILKPWKKNGLLNKNRKGYENL